MCGRFALFNPLDRLLDAFGIDGPPPDDPLHWLRPRYNIAPTEPIAVIARSSDAQPKLGLMRWGLVPATRPDPSTGPLLINARAETVATKPSFHDAFARRRCLVPLDGFYEWHGKGKAKQAYFVRPTTQEGPHAMAGLWDRWQRGGQQLLSVTLITTAASNAVQALHDRMPAVLTGAGCDAWLARSTAPAALHALLQPYSNVEPYPVSSAVNKAGNDGPALILPLRR